MAAVIGNPVRHSLSPALHNAAFAAAGLDWVYVAFEVPDGAAARALDGVRALGIEGLSVTMPHKAAVAAAVDRLDPAAARLGAVNCVVRRGDELTGYNTDGDGFLDSLRLDGGFDPAGRTAAVIGAGGAARAVIAALAGAGAARISVTNRDRRRGAEAVALAPDVAVLSSLDAVTGADLVVNATSVGMERRGHVPGEVPLDPGTLRAGQLVVDLVYQPLDTALLAAARERGAATLGGLGMLLFQAARAFELWTGHPAPTDAMRAALVDRFGR